MTDPAAEDLAQWLLDGPPIYSPGVALTHGIHQLRQMNPIREADGLPRRSYMEICQIALSAVKLWLLRCHTPKAGAGSLRIAPDDTP
jgi:hypothetical protein